jgi:hypothetical protein
MEVEVDTIQEVELEPHRIFILNVIDHVVILRNNCIGEAVKIVSGVKRCESFHGSKQVQLL